MEEMINRLFEELAKQTARAVNAERLAEDLRANLEKAKDDANFWMSAHSRVQKQLNELKENKDEHI